MTTPLVLSCEHASRAVPRALAPLFAGAALRRALGSHRGSDLGASALARELARALGCPLFEGQVSRLVVDANRSLAHPRVFSSATRALCAAERAALVERYWRPQRERVEACLRAALARHGRAVHVGVHSFTPSWRGADRATDVALLYDPARARERDFARRFLAELALRDGALRLRRNFPYRGTSDGLTRDLRRALGPRYLGLELEVSQAFPAGPSARWGRLRADLAAALAAALER